jgi:hypothetical protein
MEQHCFWKLDPYPHWREKLDPDQHLNQNSGVLEAQNGALEGRERLQWRRGGQKWSPGGSIGPWSQIRITLMRSRIRIRVRIKVKSWIDPYVSEKLDPDPN